MKMIISALLFLSLPAFATEQEPPFEPPFYIDVTTVWEAIQTKEIALAPEHNKTYALINTRSGKCLDVKDHSKKEGSVLQQWTCHFGKNQLFNIKSAYKFGWTITAVESGLRVMVKDANSEDGVALVQGSYASGNNGYFRFHELETPAIFNITSGHAGKCLDIFGIKGPNENNGSVIGQWSCLENYGSQEWVLVEFK